MSPRPILFIHHANDMYGADIGLLHSIRSLDREKYFPIVILPSDMPTGMLSPELERLGVEFHFANLGILRRKYLKPTAVLPLILEILRGVAFVRSMARNRDVALVYINTFVTVSGAIGGRLAGVPVLWHIREILSLPRPIRWTLYGILRLCADRVVCISKAVRESVLKEAPGLAQRSVVVYNAVSMAASSKDKGQHPALREELGLHRDALLVGMVGRISHWKGQEILAQAS
jgi:glycosyltransferase involved in cell wall biosynthesis